MFRLFTESVARYRIGIEAGNGQHVLITDLKSTNSQVEGTQVVWRSAPSRLNQGETVTLLTEISNVTDRILENLTAQLVEPYGYGLVAQGDREQKISRLAVGETVSLSWTVTAQRASAVNLGRPWDLRLMINKSMAPAVARLDVTDPAPGQVFYVMTEDLEPIDAAGYPTAWGNQNGWLDAEEFRVQLIHKAEALNRIAEKHGAFWTHYLAMPVLEAGEWAAAQSSKPEWRKTWTRSKNRFGPNQDEVTNMRFIFIQTMIRRFPAMFCRTIPSAMVFGPITFVTAGPIRFRWKEIPANGQREPEFCSITCGN